jgi:MinD-like ATPase involved in chromosome partitioning or flagellar assembly
MDEQQAGRTIRVVVAAPFREIVGIHEKVSEYADELDVCGVVSSAGSVAEQTRILQPEVLVLSENLGIKPAGAAARLAATAPATKLVMLVSSRETVPPGAADAVLRLDASAGELRAAILLAAGRLRGQAAPPAHSRAGRTGAESSRWFWEDPDEPGALQPGATAEAASLIYQTSAPAPPGQEASSWPPPWLHIAADTGEPEALDGPAPPGSTAAASSPFPTVTEAAAVAAAEPGAAELEAPPEPAPRGRGRGKRARVDEPEPVEAPAAAPVEPESEAATADLRAAEPDPVPADPEPAWQLREPATEAVEETPVPAAPVEEPEASLLTAATAAAPAPVVVSPGAVVEAGPEAEPEEEALLEQPRKRVRRPGRTKADTVLVFSGKGGVGKSVIATNLAVAMSARGAKVALIDLNLQYGDVSVLLHVESHVTSIESLAQQGEQVDRDYLDEVMATGPEDVRILLAPASPEFADLVTAASLRAILRELSRGYDYIIVDSPAHIEERILEVMEVADQILVISSFNITSVKDTKVTLKLLQSLGIEHDRIAVLLNQTHPKVGFPREEIEKSLRREVLVHLPYDARIDESIDTGRPAVIGEPRSEFSKQIKVVVDFLAPDEGQGEEARADQGRDRASKRRLFGR